VLYKSTVYLLTNFPMTQSTITVNVYSSNDIGGHAKRGSSNNTWSTEDNSKTKAYGLRNLKP